eukprot:scaffold4757_cov177-Amphora_coffeaeformis.AAC.1
MMMNSRQRSHPRHSLSLQKTFIISSSSSSVLFIILITMMENSTTTFYDESEEGLLNHDHHHLDHVNEDSPLLIRHMSMETNPSGRTPRHRRDDVVPRPPSSHKNRLQKVVSGTQAALPAGRRVILVLLSVVLALSVTAWISVATTSHYHHYQQQQQHHRHGIVPIQDATEYYVEVDPGIFVWYRTWGNPVAKPVVFVHGGPGNAIADYGVENAEFFSAEEYFVVEVDQRGTGKSQPSVRESAAHMQYYTDISIDQIAEDYEKVREQLGMDQWLVFGGSFGSTVGINYATRYPEACLGLIVRGIYLDTPAEMQAVYARSSHVNNPQRLHEFDILYDYVQQQQQQQQQPQQQMDQTTRDEQALYIDPNDAQALTAAYAKLIEAGDRQAIWHWHVYENNLMETEPANLLDPNQIDETVFPEAQSVAFFETRLWLRGAYEHPAQLLSRVDRLAVLPHISICQGRHDEVCPAKYTRLLTNALNDANAFFTVSYLNSGHEQSDPVMAACLKERLTVFGQEYYQQRQQQQHQQAHETKAGTSASPKKY